MYFKQINNFWQGCTIVYDAHNLEKNIDTYTFCTKIKSKQPLTKKKKLCT